MTWHDEQYRRLAEALVLQGAVVFDSHGNDMPQWYANIDFILSVSDHESFHLAGAEGAASGCIPIVLPWEGADEIYPKEWVYDSIQACWIAIRVERADNTSLPEVVKHHFDRKSVARALLENC